MQQTAKAARTTWVSTSHLKWHLTRQTQEWSQIQAVLPQVGHTLDTVHCDTFQGSTIIQQRNARTKVGLLTCVHLFPAWAKQPLSSDFPFNMCATAHEKSYCSWWRDCVDVLCTKYWMCCVLIRIQRFFIVCAPQALIMQENIFLLPGICWPQAEYDYTFLFYPLSARLLSCIVIPLLCFALSPPHSPFSSFFFSPNQLSLLQSAFTIVLKKLRSFTHGKCFLFASRAPDTIGFALTSSLVS